MDPSIRGLTHNTHLSTSSSLSTLILHTNPCPPWRHSGISPMTSFVDIPRTWRHSWSCCTWPCCRTSKWSAILWSTVFECVVERPPVFWPHRGQPTSTQPVRRQYSELFQPHHRGSSLKLDGHDLFLEPFYDMILDLLTYLWSASCSNHITGDACIDSDVPWSLLSFMCSATGRWSTRSICEQSRHVHCCGVVSSTRCRTSHLDQEFDES